MPFLQGEIGMLRNVQTSNTGRCQSGSISKLMIAGPLVCQYGRSRVRLYYDPNSLGSEQYNSLTILGRKSRRLGEVDRSALRANGISKTELREIARDSVTGRARFAHLNSRERRALMRALAKRGTIVYPCEVPGGIGVRLTNCATRLAIALARLGYVMV